MTFSEAIKSAFRKYAGFKGRARRSEFWNFILFLFLAGLAFELLRFLFGGAETVPGALVDLVSRLFGLAILVPALAVQTRRLHDTGRSGWWIFLQIVPAAVAFVYFIAAAFANPQLMDDPNAFGSTFVYPILLFSVLALSCSAILIVYECQAGQQGENRYGPDPKAPPEEDAEESGEETEEQAEEQTEEQAEEQKEEQTGEPEE